MSKIRAAVIGCGGIANGKHLPALAALKDRVEVVAFCDIVEDRAQKACKEYGTPDAKVYTDYKELLKDASIDTVHVCTPNRSHSFISIDAMEAGKHVICEKPMAKTYADAKAMYECSLRTGKILTIGYQNRYRKDSMFIKKLCKDGELGDVYYAKAHAIRRRGVPTWGVFLNEYEQGGGPLIDIGTHALDLTLWCMDNYKPKAVLGTAFKKLGDQKETGNPWADWNRDEFTVEDSAFGMIVMEDGATVQLESSWALNTLDVREAQTTLCGTKAGVDMIGGVRINGVKFNKQYVMTPDLAGQGVAFFDAAGGDEPHVVELSVFLNAVEGKGELVVKPEQALMVTRLLEAIYESSATGKAVYFDED
ncbi:MAG: Gfo/Idh/MocA family oxidoreductase [Clostridia bacterium]|nr:Gfo/Idh/MocA family oxidoreductase [Clostridia bacterium]